MTNINASLLVSKFYAPRSLHHSIQEIILWMALLSAEVFEARVTQTATVFMFMILVKIERR